MLTFLGKGNGDDASMCCQRGITKTVMPRKCYLLDLLLGSLKLCLLFLTKLACEIEKALCLPERRATCNTAYQFYNHSKLYLPRHKNKNVPVLRASAVYFPLPNYQAGRGSSVRRNSQ